MNLYRYIATMSYILSVVLLNILFVKLPGFNAFGDTLSFADLVVGIIYVVRDLAQQEIQHRIIIAMLIGTLLSFILADPNIAMASACGFAAGECCDWLVFSYTRRPLSERLLISSLLSIPIDTWIFLAIAHRLNLTSFFFMAMGKCLGILLLWIFWKKKSRTKYSTSLTSLQPALK